MFRAKFSTQNPEIAVHSFARSAMFDISLPSLFCERLENEARHPPLWREKEIANIFFSGLVSLCFISFIKLYKRDIFHVLKFKVT